MPMDAQQKIADPLEVEWVSWCECREQNLLPLEVKVVWADCPSLKEEFTLFMVAKSLVNRG